MVPGHLTGAADEIIGQMSMTLRDHQRGTTKQSADSRKLEGGSGG
jgi:hypothetical protein